jgi:hypothetical protein
VGQANKIIQAPAGATENQPSQILSTYPGLIQFRPFTHGSRRGLLSFVAPRLRTFSKFQLDFPVRVVGVFRSLN